VTLGISLQVTRLIFVIVPFVGLGCSTAHTTSATDHEQQVEPRLLVYEPDVWVAPSRQDPVAVDGGSLDIPPVLTNKTTPEYPFLALRAGIEGIIVLAVVVGPDGEVEDVTTVSSRVTYAMELSAIETIYQFVYRPGTRNWKCNW